LSIQYLYKRNSTYYFRIRIPLDLQQWFSGGEIKRSLKTRDRQTARLYARKWLAKADKLFAYMRSDIFTEDQLGSLIQKCRPSDLVGQKLAKI